MNLQRYIYPYGYLGESRGYVVDGEVLPGVTSILQKTKSSEDKKALDAWKSRTSKSVQQSYLDRGTALHSELEYYLEYGEFRDVDKMEWLPSKKGLVSPMAYLKGAIPFLDYQKPKPLLIEGCVYHPFGYAGRVDAVVQLNNENEASNSWNGESVLLDWKSSDSFKSSVGLRDYEIQLSAYLGALNHVYPKLKINKAMLVICVKNELAQIRRVEPTNVMKNWDLWKGRLQTFKEMMKGQG